MQQVTEGFCEWSIEEQAIRDGWSIDRGEGGWWKVIEGGEGGGQEEVETLEEGEVRPREAARPASQQRTSPQYSPGRQYGQQALGGQATRGQVPPRRPHLPPLTCSSERQ